MKTMNMMKKGLALAGFAALCATAQAADIYEIRPCRPSTSGSASFVQADAYATLDAPLSAGRDCYFVMRLVRHSVTSPHWRLVHNDATWGSPTLDEIMYPLQVGVFVSGKLRWADLVETQFTYASPTGDGYYYTDFIFKYTTKPGDFALPIKLAVEDEFGNYVPASEAGSASAYVFNRLSTANGDQGKWQIRDKDNVTGEANDGNFAELVLASSVDQLLNQRPWGTRETDFTLKKCGFFVKTVDFHPEWEVAPEYPDPGVWRSVHEASTKIGYGSAQIVADAAVDEAVELYVWSTDESAVRIQGGFEAIVVTNKVLNSNNEVEDQTTRVQMAKVTIVGGDIYGAFRLYGVSYPKTATLVLSPYRDFTYDINNDRVVDYIEVPVMCSEKEAASVYVEINPTEVTADGDLENAKSAVAVYLNQEVDVPVHVTLTPTFLATNGNDSADIKWEDYFRFAQDESVAATPTKAESETALTVEIPANSTARQYIYIYPLRSDDYTRTRAKPIRLTPTLGDGEQTASGIRNLYAAGFTIKAAKPVITGAEHEDAVESGTPLSLEISLSDIYADITDEDTGYTVKINGTTLQDKYIYKNEKLVSKDDNTKLPTITYNTSGDKTITIQVMSPYGRQWSEIYTSQVNVKDVTTVVVRTIDGKDDKYNEGDDINFQIGFFSGDDQVKLGQTAYAFLYSDDEIDLGTFDENFIVTNLSVVAEGSSGIKINKDVVDWTPASMMALDGANAAKNGAKYRFSVVLCTSKKFDPANIISGYPTSQELNFRVYNVEPVMGGIYVNDSADAYEDGATYPTKVPVGQTRRFRPDVTDPGQFDLESTADPFKVQWSVYLDGELYEDDPFVIDGNPTGDNPTNFYYTFTQAGVYTFRCKVKDKDMTKYSTESCSISVEVLDQPYVKVTGPNEMNPDETTIDERDLANARFKVGLDYFDNRYNGDIQVKLEVVQYGGANRVNPGRLDLDSLYASPTEPGVYYVTLNKSRKLITINAIELDGTDNSQLFGFEIKASVVNTDNLPTPNRPANEYYLESSHRVYIGTVEPYCLATPEENTNRWEVAGGLATGHPITWKVQSDVIDDFTNKWADGVTEGIRVSISGPVNGFTTNITETAGGTFVPNFGSLTGPVDVLLTIEDKDGGMRSWTWQFTVTPSKFLVTQSTGPSGGTSSSPLSQKYVLAGKGAGIGEGHTYVSGAIFTEAEKFSLKWNCSKLVTMTIYAYGYKMGDVDDGSLSGGADIAIDGSGNRSDPDTVPGSPYEYSDSDGKDSYFYCWLVTEPGDTANSANISILNNTILPERPGRVTSSRVQLPTETTQDGNYIDTHVEAIFAREWLTTDNLGDINQDGVPDVFVHTTWGNGKILDVLGYDSVQDDLRDIAGSNPDEDYLPGIYGANGQIANVNSTGSSYAPIGLAFTTRREFRGLGTGLNEKGISDPDFTTVESNAYYVAVEGKTLKEIADERGKDPGDREAWFEIPADALSSWSPEPKGRQARLDPTMDDTDSDNLPDGWEYFFWYAAHVWVPGGGYKLQAGQKYPFERFWPERLIVGHEIPASEVERLFNPLSPRENDEARNTYDFDEDGLSDLEELIIGTNPCHWDTDGDHMCDGWEVMMCLDPLNGGVGAKFSNEDGDFMAYDYHGGVLAWYDEASGKLYFDASGSLKPILDYTVESVNDDNGNLISNIYTTVDRDIQLNGAVVSIARDWGDGPEPLRYGRDDDTNPDAMNDAAVYGACLCQMGTASCTIPAGSSLYMESFVYIHDQVRQLYGFDPRTAWNNVNGLVSSRWTPTEQEDVAGVAQMTKRYNAYDEYLLARYRMAFNVTYPDQAGGIPELENGRNGGVWNYLRMMTTQPTVLIENAVDDGQTADATTGDDTTGDAAGTGTATDPTSSTTSDISERLAEAFSAAGSGHAVVRGHGADSDGDGVPDGWELYMRRNPNAAPGEEEDPPPLGRNLMTILPRDIEDDGLPYVLEFAGLDTCDAYANCESIYRNSPREEGSQIYGWYNKFFPTHPDEADTDRDSIADGLEGRDLQIEGQTTTFIFGTPSDDGSRCIRGGGMNPLTVDTDQDGLPDAWELQYAGEIMTVSDVIGDGVNVTAIADGLLGDRQTTYDGEYVVGGMDATWPGDVYTDPSDGDESHSYDALLGTVRDVDFDHDGLENYQEYLVQTVRHFRWDDITTPLMGRVLYESVAPAMFPHEQGFLCYTPMSHSASEFALMAAWNAYGAEGITVTVTTNGMSVITNEMTSVVVTNYITTVTSNVSSMATAVRNRMSGGGAFSQPWTQTGWKFCGYMSMPEKGWDRSYTDVVLSNPAILLPPLASPRFSETDLRSYIPYVSTDPRAWDTDADGMDDYYEMFHGLNPLLGSATPGSKDVICDAYGLGDLFNAAFNEWTNVDYDRSMAFMGYPPPVVSPQRQGPIAAPLLLDFVMYPWFAGAAEADPDGDGINNYEEMLRANLTSPAPTHTDPTPAWFTDPGLAMSFVNQYYRNFSPVRIPDNPEGELPFKPAAYSTTDPYYDNAVKGSMRELPSDPAPEFGWTFEENEGYDTDNDWVADGREIIKTVKVATDPLDFSDPDRRQAAWFDGNDSFMMTKTQAYRGSDANDMLKQFTVEAWVRPEKRGVEQTILDRCSLYGGNTVLNPAYVIRSNFRFGLDTEGRVFGLFDNSDALESGSNEPVSCQRVTGQILPLNEWTHVAMTYTGRKLTLYVNGQIADSAETTLIPATGVRLVEQDVGEPTLYGLYEFVPTTFYIGARPIHTPLVEDRMNPLLTETVEYGYMREFFQGYVDEVRVWDGARTSAEILENYRKRMTMDDARENRIDVYQVWANRGTRNDNDGLPMLPPELLMHYNFCSLPGAVKPTDVAKTPSGFDKAVKKMVAANYENDVQDLDDTGMYSVAYPSRSTLVSVAHNLKGGAYGTYDLDPAQDLACGWWGACATKSLVYDDYSIVPWAENTVAHLPAMDGSTFDSFYYAEKLGGSYTPASDANVASFIFPNAANPYPYYTYYLDRYLTLFRRNRLFEQRGEEFEPLLNLYRYDVRSRLVGPSDLLPMGNAYARRCEEMWDGAPADAWEYTAVDENANGISDWWEAYARANYGGLEWDQDVDWNTLIIYFGNEVPAYQAFLIDLARGLQPDGLVDSAFVSTADDNGNNLPDWWENLFGVRGGADADDDNDGLSNYAEYMLSFGAAPYGIENGFPLLDPTKPRTGKDQKVTDYFLSGPDHDIDDNARHISANSYLGRIVTDSDFMEDWWEKKYNNSFSSIGKYDPDYDKDEDGWSNWAEARSYMWRGSFTADLIDGYFDSATHANFYPQPAIGIKVTYHGVQDVSGKGIIARTFTGNSPRVDATFNVLGASDAVTDNASKILGGYYAGNVMHGNLGPGRVLPQTVHFLMARMSGDGTYYWYDPRVYPDPSVINYYYDVDCGFGTYVEYRQALTYNPAFVLDNVAIQFMPFADTSADAEGHFGDIIYTGTNNNVATSAQIGKIDYRTGEFSIDLGTLATVSGQALDNYLFSAEWQYRVGHEYPQTFWLCEPVAGRVKEGRNTIEVFIDIDGDGAYTAGVDPYGALQDVEIGWHKTRELVIEVKDESAAVARTAIASDAAGAGDDGDAPAAAATGLDALTTKVVVRRMSINGQSAFNGKTVPVRTLVSKTFVNDDRAYLTEADAVSAVLPDLDWKWLMKDAAKLGIAAKDLRTVGYEIATVTKLADGTTTNTPIATFENEFLVSRTVPVPKEPIALAPVYSAYPSFSFSSSDETMKAYRLQIAIDTNATDVVFDTGVKPLPGRTGYTDGVSVYEVSPEFYWNCSITTNGSFYVNDNTNYYWRVALLNSKFNDTALESDWCKWSAFQMDVENVNRHPAIPTGYGKCGVVVRYFGCVQTNDLANAIVVEAFESADFTGMPVDRKRYEDVSRLSERTDISTVDVVLGGIEPGTVYLRAYIDLNNNGKRDAWEPWGYANRVGSDLVDIFTPDGATITDEVNAYDKKVIYIEDPDTNRNEIPDCTEETFFSNDGSVEVLAEDTDGDGLSDDDEDSYGTDASMWDSDGDGMPDGWEVWADTDALFEDAEECTDGDVMAFATMPAKLVTIKSDEPNAEPVTYILPTGAAVPTVGDRAAGLELYSSFQYPVVTDGMQVDYIGRGGLVTIADPEGYVNRVVGVKDGTVALVHAQVYAEYGFDPLTAVPVTNAVNTKAFTALDKYLIIRYFESLGICSEAEVNRLGLWKDYSLYPYNVDCDEDGLPDGWELYVMFGPNAMDAATFAGGNAITPWNFDDRDVDGDGDDVTLVHEYDAMEPSNPWNMYSVYESLLAKRMLLPGTSQFTDAEARRFGIGPDELDKDDDNDQVTNLQELQAYYYDRAALADIDPKKAWSDGETPDYFRAAQSTYLGGLFNGGEFIERSVRTAMGIETYARAGTRDYRQTGWDAWSTARYSILNEEKSLDIDGVVSDELMLLIRYWNVIRPGEFTGTTVGDALEFFHEVWAGIKRLIDDEGNVLVEVKNGSVAGAGTIHDADAAQTTTQVVAFFGGQAKMEETIALNKKDLTAEQIVTPEAAVNLVLKYAGNESYNLVLEAYQMSSAYPEYGEQLSAQWTIPVKFDAGVAKINEIKTPSLGSLKQGQARFVAYIDVDGDGKLSDGDISGSTATEVGYLGCDVAIALGEANPALPALRLSEDGEQFSTLAIVRSAVNGKPLYNSAKGVFIVQFPNNASREALYPGEYDSGNYIGIDPTLSSLENIDEVEEVTYEVLRLNADQVAGLSITNLNNYIIITSNGEDDDGVGATVYSNIVSRTDNETFTLKYSLGRDVAKSIACAGSTADDFTFTFTVPTDTANTKFWLNVQTNGAEGATLLGGDKGFILKDIRDGVVVLDRYWFEENRITIPTGPVKFGVILGNDKFGKPLTASCAMAEAVINEGASFEGRLAVKVEHPTAALDAKLTVAVYEKADLASPVVVTNGCAAGEAIELGGLRPGASYYVAAWYVNDEDDGRGSANRRMPYDTWGYVTALDETNSTQVVVSGGFDARALVAEVAPLATNTVWLQDTDWNGNNIIDREESFRGIDGDYVRSVDPVYGFDIAGVEETDVFSDAVESDVFAYAEVPFYCVMAEIDGFEAWFAVADLGAETVSDKVTPGIPVGTSLKDLVTLKATYFYDFGVSNPKRLALGTNVVWTGEEKVVKVAEQKALILVHDQVYDYFGFDPNTANGRIDKDHWVNTRAFTSADKNYVTNYLANVLGWEDSYAYALPPDYPDADPVTAGRGDGILDGWELYVKHSPWDFDDRTFDADGDGLDQLHEYDGGVLPTDPWEEYTYQLDGIDDYTAYHYRLKTAETQLADDDNDGLSNWAEYLASQLTGLDFKVDNPCSVDPLRLDYFFQFEQDGVLKYIGECIDADGYGLISDHDFMEDWWEDRFPVDAANRYAYDAHEDPDGDGWSNWAERQALTPPNRAATLSLVRADGAEDHAVEGYPIPTVRMTVASSSGEPIDSRLVVKAWSSSKTNATWTVAGSGEPSAWNTRFLGLAPNRKMKFNIGPGDIAQKHVRIQIYDPEYWIETIDYGEGASKVTYTYHTIDTSEWSEILVFGDDPTNESNGLNTGAITAGWVNYVNGDIEVDFSAPAYRDTDATVVASSSPDQVVIYHYDLTRSFFRASWMGRLVEDGSVKKFSISKADSGYLREGLNTFEVFADLDGDGQYTVGEPVGIARNVNVGWDMVPEVAIDLRVEAPSGARFFVPAQSNATTRVCVARTKINGVEVQPRTIYARTLSIGDGRSFSEVDLVKNGEWDFDWKHLVSDAKSFAHIGRDAILSADYSVYADNVSNVLYEFTRTFSAAPMAPVPLRPTVRDGYVVASAQPELVWSAHEGYTAFVLQIATDEDFQDIVCWTTNSMPAVLADGCHFKPEAYVNEKLALDGGEYYWRVAELNSKYTEPTWSETASFKMAVNTSNADTGYGSLGVEVRYYGPADTALSNVVVGVYESADFACKPVALLRLSGDDIVSTLVNAGNFGDVDEAAAGYLKFDGIAPGSYYVMAFVDANCNNRRDPWESWGYVNKIGTSAADIYTPRAIEVVSTKATAPKAILVMEDTDVNQNWMPDCLEDTTGWGNYPDLSASDLDRDGLSDASEDDDYGTDASVWDTDGDGMPDGWEVWADTDALFEDSYICPDGDVMAFVEQERTIVTVLNTAEGSDPAVYILGDIEDGRKMPVVGDSIDGYTLYGMYDYPVVTEDGLLENRRGRGREVVLAAADGTTNRVIKVSSAKVVLVHAQVYEVFGFNPNTANGTVEEGDRVNTKPFTALDKYLVARYLEAIGIEPPAEEKDAYKAKWDDCYGLEDWVNVNGRWADYTLKARETDSDLDGLPDGWELYVMFGNPKAAGQPHLADADLVANATISPWNYGDARDTSPSVGSEVDTAFRVIDEYDGGHVPTDPWAVDTDGDGVSDRYAFRYHLKGDDSWKDNDGDGLSNYAEYLISEVFKFAKLDPDKAKTDDSVVDYFRRVGEMYLGEIFTDHDKVGDQWEQEFAKADFDGNLFASPGTYDPSIDPDNDGWSNYAEFRAGTDPDVDAVSGIDGFTLTEHPVPVVEVNLVYNGAESLVGSVQFKAWNEGVSGDLTRQPDAVWTVGKTVEMTTTTAHSGETTSTEVDASVKYIGTNPREEKTFYLGPGVVQAGTFRLFFKDTGFVWVDTKRLEITSIGLVEDANWYYFVVDKNGKLVTLGGEFAGETEVGTIDYKTGRVTIDFSNPALNEIWFGDPDTAEQGNNTSGGNGRNGNNNEDEYQSIRLDQSYVKIVWQSKSVSANATGKYYLADCDVGYRGLIEGSATITVEFMADEANSSGTSGGATGDVGAAKKVFGMVRHVEVGWAGAKVEIELNEFSPVTPRLDLQAGTSDRPFSFDEARYTSDRRVNWETNVVTEATLPEGRTRVRVVRFAANGYPAWFAGVPARVVFDDYFNSSARTVLHEGDFLDDNSFDIDWANLDTEVLRASGVQGLLGSISEGGVRRAALTNMCYLVVIGEGKVSFNGASDAGELNAFRYVVERRFDLNRAKPALDVQPTVVYSARPTFTWSMPDENPWTAKYGSSYTAFKLQILDSADNVVWDGGMRRAPATDEAGRFTWTAPVCAGGFTQSAKVLEPGVAYKWRVSMYNAKYTNDDWSAKGTFTMMANAQQEMNDRGYSSIEVAVKYAGPSTVLSKYKEHLSTNGVLRVQAFASPDFTGDPMAEAIATNEVEDISINTPNVRLVGLPANGTYYVRAYIDMNGNGELDEWEPWGYERNSVVLSASQVTSPVVGVWIEDADTDGDWLPDAWEYAQAGWIGEWSNISARRGFTSLGSDQVVLTESFPDISAKIASGEFDAAISRGLPGASITVLMDGNFAAALTGLDVSNKSSIEAIRDAIEKKVVPNTLRITSITLDTTGAKVILGVDADVAESIAGRLFGQIYNLTPGTETADVVVKVYKKTSLAQADWELVQTKPVSIGAGEVNVEVDLDEAVDYTSGYFRVEVEQ